jgi:hypothetical protein
MVMNETYSIGKIFLSLKMAPDEAEISLNSVFLTFLFPEKRTKTSDISFNVQEY